MGQQFQPVLSQVSEHLYLIFEATSYDVLPGIGTETEVVMPDSGEADPFNQAKLDKLNRIEVQFNQLVQQVEVNRENYRLYLTKFEESRISDAMDSEKISSVSLIQPARPPHKPVSPKKMLNIVLAIFLGAFGGLGLAFFMEYLDDKIEKVEDVARVGDEIMVMVTDISPEGKIRLLRQAVLG